MTFIFDFDHTLFDTNAFRKYLFYGGFIKYFIGFRRGELDRFVYPDAVDLIETLTSEHCLILVTAGTKMLQKKRIYSCSFIQHFDQVYFSNWKEKGPIIAKLYQRGEKPMVYVENHPLHLESVLEHASEVKSIRMQRSGGPYFSQKDDRFISVRSIADLREKLQKNYQLDIGT